MIADAVRTPTHHDLESLYRVTTVEGWSTTRLAPTLNLRVEEVEAARQMATESVRQRAEPSRWPAERWLDFVQDLATERMDFLYSEAMEAWRESKKPTASDGKSPRCGQPHYLTVAMRIAERSALFTQRMYAAGQVLKLRLEQATKRAADVGQSNAPPVGKNTTLSCADNKQNPPVRDCSPKSAEQSSPAAQPAEDLTVSNSNKTTSDKRNPKRVAFLAPLSDEFQPVQPQVPGGVGGGRESGVGSQEKSAMLVQTKSG